MQKKILGLLLLLVLFSCSWSASPGEGALPAGVQSFAPTGRVSENVSFRIVFKDVMVSAGDVDKTVGPEDFPFTVTPAIQAEGKWQNPRTFRARLLAPLDAGTSYVAAIREGLKTLKGGKIGTGEFRFQTDSLSVNGVRAVRERGGRAALLLEFNMPVDPVRLKGFLSVLNENEEKLSFSLAGALPSKTIRAQLSIPDASKALKLTVKLASGLTAGGGDLGLAEDYSATVILKPVLVVESLGADEESIAVNCSFAVDTEAAKDFISIEPSVPFTLSYEYGGRFSINGDFKPRSRFVVTLRKGLPAKEGGLVLEEEFKQAVIMPDLKSSISLPAPGVYLAAIGDGRVPLDLVNVKKLQVDLWRLYENNIPYVIRGDYDSFQRDLAKRVHSSEFDLSLPLNEKVRRALSLEELGGGKRGLFLLSVRDPDGEYWDEETQIVNLSDLGLVARVWEDGMLLWANTLSSVQPVEGAEVRVYSGANQVLAEGKTDKDGLLVIQRQEPWSTSENETPKLAVVTRGEDITFVRLTRGLLSQETFDTAGRPWLRSGYDAALFSPRDIYRTGEEAPFKAVVRNSDVTTPKAFPVLFVARDPLGRKVRQETVLLDDEGGAPFTLSLPSNALTGAWTLSLVVPGKEDDPLARMNFHVEDFAPPRIEVKAETESKFLLHEDTVKMDVYARYLFGVDGAGLPAKAYWTTRASDFAPVQDRWKGYVFGDSSRAFSAGDGEFDEAKLDESGKAEFSLSLDADWSAPSTIALTLRAEVQEDGGRWVSKSLTLPYYPTPWLLGIAAPEGKLAVKKDLDFKVAAIDPKEDPADPGELNAVLYRVTWNYNMVTLDGHTRWQSTEELTEVAKKSLTLKDGLGTVSFKPDHWGTYLIRVSDGDEKARASYRFYADDPAYADRGGSQLLDRVEVETDREFYKVGDTAKVTLRSPFEGLLLFSVEGAGLISRNVVKVDKAETVVEVPVTAEMVPNAWCTAWLIRPVAEEEAWGAHRAVGAVRLKTDLSPYRLDISMEAKEKTEPATAFPVTLTLRDAEGKPAKAEVSLALVDDAVLGLTGYKTPDLLNHFWGLKELGSQGYDLYDLLIPVESRGTELLHPAGGAAVAALAGSDTAQRFKILSLFQGVLSADESGVVRTELVLPEFSGRGKLFAVAASGNRFGMAEQAVQIARSVVTEADLPRFAAPGDAFNAPVTVFNTSEESRDVKVEVLVQGGLKPEESATTLSIGPKESARWGTTVKALEPGTATWTVRTSWSEEGAEKSFDQEIELPVRSPWPIVSRSGSGTFKAGETRIDIPRKDFAGDLLGSLTLSDSPAVDLTRAVTYLLNYPYGCLEQTLSSAWPFLVLPEAVAKVDPLLVDSRAAKDKTDSAIARIQSMQLYDGSFTMWPGGTSTYAWGSVYATHFLVEARKAGVPYPEEMLRGAMNWLKEYLASLPDNRYPSAEKDDFTTKAYGTYVLALSGEKPLGWIEYLKENQTNMWPSGAIWLAGAAALTEGRPDALRALGLKGGSAPAESRYRTLESDVRNDAQLLSLWMEVESGASEAVQLAARLLKAGEENRWYSTQDNAAVLMALGRYSLKVGTEKAQLEGALLDAEKKELLQFRSGSSASAAVSDLPESGLVLSVNGTGSGYYSWTLLGYPVDRPEPESRGLKVTSTWLDEKGNKLDPSRPVPQGMRIQVVLTLVPSLPVSNLALSCLLPAGLEIENPRLSDEGEEASLFRSDVRDDRLLLFADRISEAATYRFRVRAVTKGTFAMPPISAEGMYDPEIRFIGETPAPLVIE